MRARMVKMGVSGGFPVGWVKRKGGKPPRADAALPNRAALGDTNHLHFNFHYLPIIARRDEPILISGSSRLVLN